MSLGLKIYLDVCCFNRPFDDNSQDRIRLEAEAVKAIIHRIENKVWRGVASPIIDFEIAQMSDPDRMIEVGLMARKMKESIVLTNSVYSRAQALEKLGFGGLDSIHLACAEKANADVFLTTDDALLKRAQRLGRGIYIHVDNPLRWFEKVVKK